MKPVMQSVDLTPNRPLVPLPDGSRRIPLGSGEITRCIGHGGMAAVYEIWNSQLEMYRAVKIINPGSDEIVHERFQTEIKISAKLKHPNIVEIYGVGEWNKLPYIEMEKIDGVGLDEVIAKHGALPAAICTAVGIQICRALNYAHNQDCTIYGKSYHGVIHRDLKPANIMIGENGTVKLMDFGIARPADVSFHTMDGLVAGTLQYLAPEQIERKKLDMRTDLYALGLVMYEIVTGAITFPQTSFANLVTCKTKNKFIPMEAFRIAIPRRLQHVIYKCMQFDIRNRVADAAHLLKDLESIHKTITHKTPEEILAKMMADGGGKKVVLVARKRFPWKTTCVGCLAAAGVAAGLHFGVLKKSISKLQTRPSQRRRPPILTRPRIPRFGDSRLAWPKRFRTFRCFQKGAIGKAKRGAALKGIRKAKGRRGGADRPKTGPDLPRARDRGRFDEEFVWGRRPFGHH